MVILLNLFAYTNDDEASLSHHGHSVHYSLYCEDRVGGSYRMNAVVVKVTSLCHLSLWLFIYISTQIGSTP